jgi:predicted ferric reductase
MYIQGESMPSSFRQGNLLLVLTGFLPLLAALLLTQFGKPENIPDALAFFGRAAGILGLSFFLLAGLISVRIPRFDVWFGGLTQLWKVHHVLGAASFVLVMAHPLLLAFAAARASVQAAGAVLFPEAAAWDVWTGWLAFVAMAVFLAPTFWFFGQPSYRRWKALHALAGLALVLGVTHALSLSRSLSGSWAQAIWFGYGALALAAFVYRKFLAPRLSRRAYTVINVQSVSRGVVELTLAPEGELLRYRAGQFVYLTPLDSGLASGRGEEHPYTLSSAPGERALRIAIKDAGDATRALQTVAVGSRALIEGPYGDFFSAKKTGRRELWIAGGIGLAPFLSRARAMSAGETIDVHLIYCVQDETRAHFLSELDEIASKISGFKVWKHFFYREGPLSAAFIAAHCPDFSARDVYVCGPPALTAAARRELRQGGVPASRIHSEDFTWL